MKFVTATAVALVLASSAALAQATKPAAPAASSDAAVTAKFKSADKNNNGSLDGAEVDTYKADMTKIDADKDGKISQAEFTAATKSGVIK